MMRKAGQFLDKVIAYLGYIGAGMGVISVILVMLAITVNVILRYIFDRPLQSVEEYSTYLFIIIVYMGLAYATRLEKHVNMDLVTRRLPKGVNDFLEVIKSLVTLVLIGVFFRFALKLVLESKRLGVTSPEVSQTPLWIPQMFLLLGLTFLGLEMIARTVKKLTAFQKRD